MKQLVFVRESVDLVCKGGMFSIRNCSVIHGNHLLEDQNICREKPTINQSSGESGKESCPTILLSMMESTLMRHNVPESWRIFTEIKNRYGYPNGRVLSDLLNELAYSGESFWMSKARNLATRVLKKKPGLLSFHDLCKLSLTFARSDMPEQASAMIRVLLSRNNMPRMDLLRPVFMYMLKSNIGAYLASNLLTEICHLGMDAKVQGRKCLINPDTLLFNLVLDGCVRFNEPIKGQYLIELMSKTGVVADAYSVVAIGNLHEINSQRDEMKRMKLLIDKVPSDLICHYISFYDNLMNLHFRFNDFAAAAELLLDLRTSEHRISMQILSPDKFFLLPIGPHNVKDSLKLRIAPHLVPREIPLNVKCKPRFICFKNGKLLLTHLALAKIILGYTKQGRTSDLSKFIRGIHEEFSTQMGVNLFSDVINACIFLGLPGIAHDILDDATAAGVSLALSTYKALLASYQETNLVKEAAALVKQMRDTDFQVPKSEFNQSFLSCEALSEAVKDGDESMQSMVHELNSSIYFFCKVKMIGDAVNCYKKMQKMNVQPTLQTFAYLAQAYWSLGKNRNVAFLWGDIKRSIGSGNAVMSRDLFEIILVCFVEGGYFERVMEVIDFMQLRNMFVDKQMVANEFLKLHKNLYKNISVGGGRTPAQTKRIEFVRMFKKWAGIR